MSRRIWPNHTHPVIQHAHGGYDEHEHRIQDTVARLRAVRGDIAAINEIRPWHVQDSFKDEGGFVHAVCRLCRGEWPCHAAQLLALLADTPSVEPLDVERLARAMMPIVWGKVPTEGNSPESVAEAEAAWASERDELRERARIFAAEYAFPTQASDSPEKT